MSQIKDIITRTLNAELKRLQKKKVKLEDKAENRYPVQQLIKWREEFAKVVENTTLSATKRMEFVDKLSVEKDEIDKKIKAGSKIDHVKLDNQIFEAIDDISSIEHYLSRQKFYEKQTL